MQKEILKGSNVCSKKTMKDNDAEGIAPAFHKL